MKENNLPVLIHVHQSEYKNINAAEQGMYDEICHVNYEWNGNYFGLVATGHSTLEHEKSIFSYFYKRLFILVYVGSIRMESSKKLLTLLMNQKHSWYSSQQTTGIQWYNLLTALLIITYVHFTMHMWVAFVSYVHVSSINYLFILRLLQYIVMNICKYRVIINSQIFYSGLMDANWMICRISNTTTQGWQNGPTLL